MPSRSIRDDMQTPTMPRPPRVYGTPIGATGGRPINVGRPRPGLAPPAVRQAALQQQIGKAAVPPPAPLGSQGSASLASIPAPTGGPTQVAAQPVRAPMATTTQGMPPPQASAGAPGPTTLLPGNPTRDLSAATAGNRIASRPGLMNRAIDEMAR